MNKGVNNDLISKRELLDNIRNFYKQQTAILQATSSAFVSEIEKIIEEQPVAYDVNKVVGQINDEIMETPEHRHNFCGTVTDERCVQYENCEECMAERMIEIVKSGGNWAAKPKVRL